MLASNTCKQKNQQYLSMWFQRTYQRRCKSSNDFLLSSCTLQLLPTISVVLFTGDRGSRNWSRRLALVVVDAFNDFDEEDTFSVEGGVGEEEENVRTVNFAELDSLANGAMPQEGTNMRCENRPVRCNNVDDIIELVVYRLG